MLPEFKRVITNRLPEGVIIPEPLRELKSFVIFAGQGQNLDQLRAKSVELITGNPVAQSVYGDCDRILADPEDFGERFKRGLGEILLSGSEEELRQNQQLIVLAYNMACSEILKANSEFPNRKNILAFSGQSLGLLSAIHESGAVDRRNLLRLGVMRQDAMLEANEKNPGSLIAAVAAPDDQRIKDLKREHNLQISIRTASGLTVLGGRTEDINSAQAQTEIKLKIVPLKTDGAFHTDLMNDASKELGKRIGLIEIEDAEIPIISNVTAKKIRSAREIKAEIVRQINNPVLWHEATNSFLDKADQIIEVGTDGLLTGHIQRQLEGRAKKKGEFPIIPLIISGMGIAAFVVGAALVIRRNRNPSH